MYLSPDSQVQYLMICLKSNKPKMAYQPLLETVERLERRTRDRLEKRLERDWRGTGERLKGAREELWSYLDNLITDKQTDKQTDGRTDRAIP